LENGEAASWLGSVSSSDLEYLGGDANRLYQLLVEDKGAKHNPQVLDVSALKAASARADLFSKKQVKTLSNLHVEESKREEDIKQGAVTLTSIETEMGCARNNVLAPETILQRRGLEVTPMMITSREAIYDTAGSALITPTSLSPCDSVLLAFLKEHASCLKGSPEAFVGWLSSQDILTLDDLAEAVADYSYFQNVLHQGDGTVGIKGFKRAVFKMAVIVATSGRKREVSSLSTEEDKENIQPPTELFCPISLVLMTSEPVIAADGHTYELAAIAEWFEQQHAQVESAKRQIATGSDSKQLRAIVERGIVSPVTYERMDNLALTSNKVVRSLARDAAKTKRGRKPFGNRSNQIGCL